MQVKVRVTVERVVEIPVLNFEEAVEILRNNMTKPEGTLAVVAVDERADGTREFRGIM